MRARLAMVVLGCCMVLAVTAVSQELRMSRMRTVPSRTDESGKQWVTLEMDAGETVSKQGIVIPFEANLENGQLAGYRFPRAPLMSLKPGDQLHMYITGLEAEPGATLGSGSGPWRVVTVAGLREAAGKVHLQIQEKLRLEGGSFIQEIVLTAQDGHLLSGAGGAQPKASAGMAGAEASPRRPWSFSDVPLWGWIALVAVGLAGVLGVILVRRRKPSAKSTAAS